MDAIVTISHAFASWPIEIDPMVFDMYLDGLSAVDCAEALLDMHTQAPAVLMGRRSSVEAAPMSRTETQEGHSSGAVDEAVGSPGRRSVNWGSMPTMGAGAVSSLGRTTFGNPSQTGSGSLATGASYQTLPDPFPSWLGESIGESSIILQDVQDQYRIIQYLVPFLQAPEGFVSRQHLPLSQLDRFEMTRRFYAVSDDLARALLGSKLTKQDVDSFVSLLAPYGYSESTVIRHCDNIRRLAKNISATLKSRQEKHHKEKEKEKEKEMSTLTPSIGSSTAPGAVGPGARTQEVGRDASGSAYPANTFGNGSGTPAGVPLSLKEAIEGTFLLTGDLSSRYTTLLFAYEHHLACKALQTFNFQEVSSLCSLLASTLCDETLLFVNETIADSYLARLKYLASESRVVSEWHTTVFGQAPAKRWPLHLGHTETAASASKADLTQSIVASPNTSVLQSSTSGAGSEAPSLAGSSPAGPTNSSVFPAAPSTSSTPAPSSSHSHFSRRLMTEFSLLVKSIGKLAASFSASYSLAELLDGIRERIIVPFGIAIHHTTVGGQLAAAVGRDREREPSFQAGDPRDSSSGVPNAPQTTATQRGLKELSALLVQMGVHFPSLTTVSKQDHAILDSFMPDFLMLIRLQVQLTMAQVCDHSSFVGVPLSGSTTVLGSGGSGGSGMDLSATLSNRFGLGTAKAETPPPPQRPSGSSPAPQQPPPGSSSTTASKRT